MSQTVPTFIIGDHVRIMQTSWATERQLANKTGRVARQRGPAGERQVLVNLAESGKFVEVPDSCLMRHVIGEEFKSGLNMVPITAKKGKQKR